MGKRRIYNGVRDEARTDDLQTRALSLRAETLDKEGRSVEAVLSTEMPVRVMDMRAWEPIDEVLIARGGELPAQVVLLDTHQRYDLSTVLGSVREIRVRD